MWSCGYFAAQDNTGIPASTMTYSYQSGSLFAVGTTTVTATATNAVGSSSCTFDVTVEDTEVPTISCPFDIVINADNGQCGANVTYDQPTASDNCGTSAPPTSLAGFTYKGTHGGHTYFLSNNTATPENAHAAAIAAGGHLATISDYAENLFVSQMNPGKIWIGLTDRDTEGTFKWVTNETLNYQNWAPGEPNNAGNEDWTVINWSGSNPDWNDWTFNTQAYYSVEFDGGGLPTQLVSVIQQVVTSSQLELQL